jgi:hypothetical protein
MIKARNEVEQFASIKLRSAQTSCEQPRSVHDFEDQTALDISLPARTEGSLRNGCPTGSCLQTGFEESNCDLPEADFWPASSSVRSSNNFRVAHSSTPSSVFRMISLEPAVMQCNSVAV